MAQALGWRFAKLWTASTTSALGSGLATIAAPLFVAAHTRSPLIVSATFGVAWLPWLLFALPGGVLVDRLGTFEDTVDLMRARAHPEDAARVVIRQMGARLGGAGGVILVDAAGRLGFARNAHTMAWAAAGQELADDLAGA